MAQLQRVSDNVTFTVRDNPVYRAGFWECGDQRFHAEEAAYVVLSTNPIIAPGFPVVPAIDFQLLFTTAERVALRKSTDPYVIEFVRMTDCLRPTDTVNLLLPSVAASLSYLTARNQLPANDPLTTYLADGRMAKILAGQLQ